MKRKRYTEAPIAFGSKGSVGPLPRQSLASTPHRVCSVFVALTLAKLG